LSSSELRLGFELGVDVKYGFCVLMDTVNGIC